MARLLIVGCGCRGRALGRELRADGHAVRGTTRDPGRAATIEADGLEAWVADPARIATLTEALDAVTVLCWLLGSAQGDDVAVGALHGPRLQRMLEETVDTTVRGVVYEASGSVADEHLAGGEAIVRGAHETWSIPVALLRRDAGDGHDAWLSEAVSVVRGLLGGAGAGRPSHRVCSSITLPAGKQVKSD